jgi:hypothetical protein
MDSTYSTKKHINMVRLILSEMVDELVRRGENHDASKLVDPEKSIFDEYTPKLKNSTYMSDEYKGFLNGMRDALAHHYANNSHHPEHYDNGINGMDLLDLIEMMADWKAASLRHDDGDIYQSLESNRSRFKISDQLYDILFNTIDRYLDF